MSEYQEQISDLKEQKDELAKALVESKVERGYAVGELKSLDLSNRKSLFQLKLYQLPNTRQCELLDISRSTTYYNVKLLSVDKLSLLNRIDEIYTDKPEFGYRYIYHQLL